jgi:hypothetical protein
VRFLIITATIIKEYLSIIKRSHDFYPNFTIVRDALLKFAESSCVHFSEKEIYLINLIRDSVKDEPKLIGQLNRIKKIKDSKLCKKILGDDAII